MSKDFTIKGNVDIQTTLATVGTATVIEAGDLVGLTSGVITKAVDGDTAVAYCPNGSADGEVSVEVSVGNDFTLLGTADAAFAVTDKGVAHDIIVTSTNQLIDIGASATGVLKVGISSDSGVASSTDEIEVRINKPLF